ncbi:hypothetical protein [Lichenifustis flavocetrariae]|uniref:hypothetical protein n=1 Tax=Lichenifustis flavocetrariae TaxID=2949735 RepID=UPI003D123157
MAHAANHSVPERGKFQRAVAAGWASAALFLASDLSSFVGGIDLPVDGGLTAV